MSRSKLKYALGEWDLEFTDGRKVRVRVQNQTVAAFINNHNRTLGLRAWGMADRVPV